jgi:hypothetical protein
VHRVRPTCPDNACSQCEAAELVLKLVINKNGTVKQITVVAGDSRLAGAALDAVRQWRYGRYTLNGSPVESTWVDASLNALSRCRSGIHAQRSLRLEFSFVFARSKCRTSAPQERTSVMGFLRQMNT